MSLVLIRYVLSAAVRDRVLIALLAAFLLGTSLAVFMGSAAVIEKGEFAVVFAGGGLRVAGVLGLTLFAVFHIRRSFDSKDVEFLLSRPVSRAQFLFSFAAAFSLLAAVAGLMEGACLYALAPAAPGVLFWTASVIAENIIVINAALFFAMVLPSAATGAMATFGLYVLARMMGEILGILDTGTAFSWAAHLGFIMKTISMLTPRLDLMGQTSWLIYGPSGIGYGFLVAQCVTFTALVLGAAMIDLARRKF